MTPPRRDFVRSIRRTMDGIALSVQGRPRLVPIVRRLRRLMVWSVRRFLPQAMERRELRQARTVMADAPEQPPDGPRVLFMSFRAWTSHVAWETTIAQGLRHRGARCEFFSCGGGLPICEIGWAATEEGRPCEFCAPYVASMIEAAGFPRVSLDSLVPGAERERLTAEVRRQAAHDAGPVAIDGIVLGPLVEQSLLWFFRTAALPDTDRVDRARMDFLVAAAIMVVAAPRLLDRLLPAVVVMVNGLFFEERIVREAASSRGIRVVTYEVGAQQGTLFFSDDAEALAPDYDIGDLWEAEAGRSLTMTEDECLEDLLGARRGGKGLSRRYYRRARPLRTPSGQRPMMALFTNVSWDTAVTGKARAYSSMFDWIAHAVELAAARPWLDLAIRIHPAESRWPGLETNQRAADYVRAAFPELPPNVTVIRPEDAVDSYALVEDARAVCVYSSTLGLEAAARGKAVCVAGGTHYRGRGFTVDLETPEHFERLFDDLTWAQPDPRRRSLARLYAYLFWARALVPFPAVQEDEPAEPVFTFSGVADLVPGRDPMLDLVCDGILHGGPIRRPPEAGG